MLDNPTTPTTTEEPDLLQNRDMAQILVKGIATSTPLLLPHIIVMSSFLMLAQKGAARYGVDGILQHFTQFILAMVGPPPEEKETEHHHHHHH
jgi:hypothetical protein